MAPRPDMEAQLRDEARYWDLAGGPRLCRSRDRRHGRYKGREGLPAWADPVAAAVTAPRPLFSFRKWVGRARCARGGRCPFRPSSSRQPFSFVSFSVSGHAQTSTYAFTCPAAAVAARRRVEDTVVSRASRWGPACRIDSSDGLTRGSCLSFDRSFGSKRSRF